MFISREIINKNIKFYDIEINPKKNINNIYVYTYKELFLAIDLYKNLLIDHGAKPQETVTIAEPVSIWQIAAIFASFELGLKICITDYYAEAILSRLNNKVLELDSKTKALLPINYVVQPMSKDNNPIHNKQIYNKKIAQVQVYKNFEIEDLNVNNIPAKKYSYDIDSSFIATKSATSGTTDFPKCIQHSHKFLYKLVTRNSKMFSGNFVSVFNLNHGSSIFCYLIPALASGDINNIYNFHIPDENFIDIMFNYLKDIYDENHNILLPHTSQIEKFLRNLKNNNIKLPNTIFHTLTYIPENWKKEYHSTGFIKDVVSNFGSNETTGPVFLNKISDDNFNECRYTLFDNFFRINLVLSGVEVEIPVYNKKVIMNDSFKHNKIDNSFTYMGRMNFIRINDLKVDMKLYSNIIERYLHSKIIFDQQRSKIYLAIWSVPLDLKKSVEQTVNLINDEIKTLSFDRHCISKYAILKYDDHLNGIKLDIEKIREYFRNPNGDYKELD